MLPARQYELAGPVLAGLGCFSDAGRFGLNYMICIWLRCCVITYNREIGGRFHELSLELGFLGSAWVWEWMLYVMIVSGVLFCVIDDNMIVFWIWDVVRVKLHHPEGELWNNRVGESRRMREEYGQNPVF